MAEPIFSSGTGNAAEALMDVNATITITKGGVLQIANFIATFEGVGKIRLRDTNLAGTELLRIYFAAAGLLQGDFRSSPIAFRAPAGAARVIVVTQEGAFNNSLFLAGE